MALSVRSPSLSVSTATVSFTLLQMMKTEYVDNDMIRVCLEVDGLHACCYVSSEHLVAGKEKGLRAAINRKAWATFNDSVGK